MNARIEQKLKIVVERVVRPVKAGRQRKRRMREELLDHLTALFEEEHESGCDEDAALAAATARLGQPRVLRAELQRSVAVIDRCRYWVEKQRPEPGESAVHFVIKHLLVQWIGMACLLLLFAAIHAAVGNQARLHELPMVARILAVVATVVGLLACAMVGLSDKIRRAVYSSDTPQDLRAALPFWAGSLLLFPGFLALTYGGLLVPIPAPVVWLAVLSAPVGPVCVTLSARQEALERRDDDAWAALDIGQ